MTNRRLDYADWLTPERLEAEERMWANEPRHARDASYLIRALDWLHTPSPTVIEVGAGTGWLPGKLDAYAASHPGLRYTLIDRNAGCLALAREKNKARSWVRVEHAEIRMLHPRAHVVAAFAVLKHFGLDEWQDLFVQLFEGAALGVFTVPIGRHCHNTAWMFTHVQISESFLRTALDRARHEVLWCDEESDPREFLYVTRSRS